MVEEAYVSFETAKLLKEKGFTWQTEKYIGKDLPQLATFVQAQNPAIEYFACPSQSIASRWLREVYGICIEPFAARPHSEYYKVTLYNLKARKPFEQPVIIERKYEDVVESAIRYCLENLI